MKKQEIADSIKMDSLKALCDIYDRINGDYPEHEYEGAALYMFFIDLLNSIHVKEKKNPLIITEFGIVKQFCCKELEAAIDAYTIRIFDDYETKKQFGSLKRETMKKISFFDICPYCKAEIFIQSNAELWEK